MQLAASKGALHAGGHAVFGLLLLGNVVFNYYHCVCTPPGTTEDLPHEVTAGFLGMLQSQAGIRCPFLVAAQSGSLVHS